MADAHEGHSHGPGEGHEDEPGPDARQLAAQFELVQRELERMDRRLQTLQQALIETQQAAAALRELGERKGVQETLVPVGAGVVLRGTVNPSENVIVPIGAGYGIEKSFADAAQALDQRAADVTKSFEKASSDADRLAQIASSMQADLQAQGMI